MPPKRNMKTMTIEEKSAIGIASNYGKEKPKKNTKTFVSKKDVKKPPPATRNLKTTTFTPLSLKPSIAVADLSIEAKRPDVRKRMIEGRDTPVDSRIRPNTYYRASKEPKAGWGTPRFQLGDEKGKPTGPIVHHPDAVGFPGTPRNAMNAVFRGRTVYMADTSQGAMNFIMETPSSRDHNWVIHKIETGPGKHNKVIQRIAPPQGKTIRPNDSTHTRPIQITHESLKGQFSLANPDYQYIEGVAKRKGNTAKDVKEVKQAKEDLAKIHRGLGRIAFQYATKVSAVNREHLTPTVARKHITLHGSYQFRGNVGDKKISKEDFRKYGGADLAKVEAAIKTYSDLRTAARDTMKRDADKLRKQARAPARPPLPRRASARPSPSHEDN